MITGGFAAGVRILLKKGLSRHHISEDQKNSRKIPENSILPKDSGSQKETERGARGRPHA
jgi:hypothetical protein